VNQERQIINIDVPQVDGARRINVDNRKHNPLNFRARQAPHAHQGEASHHNEDEASSEASVMPHPRQTHGMRPPHPDRRNEDENHHHQPRNHNEDQEDERPIH
jgi:hypothetical protein